MSTEEWILQIMKQQKYKRQHEAAEICMATWSGKNRKSLIPLFTML
jgi:hypothetical protein